MKRFFLLIFITVPFFLQAQTLEVGVMAGLSSYQGDLAPSNLKTSFGKFHAAFGGFARYNINNYFTAKLGINYGTISGDDANEGRKRNLSFRSNILEFAVTGEWNILGYRPYALERVFSPYLFAGISVFNFNPRAQYEGEWVDLQPLGTEGQSMQGFEEKYNLVELSIPFGAGVKYAINDQWNLGIEFGFRKTFTDYLDDVSGDYVDEEQLIAGNGELSAALANRSGEPIEGGTRRGNDSVSDWYIFTGISISYNFLDNGLVGSRSKGRKKKGCYSNF
jgi:opacity protein-like surface antigen